MVFFIGLSSFNSSQVLTKGHRYSYLDAFSFVQKQINYLDSLQPEVIKYAKIDSVSEVKKINTILDWDQQLKTFTESKVNPSTLSHNYVMAENDGFTKYVIKKKFLKNDHYPIKRIMLQFDSSDALKQIQVTVRKGNELIKMENLISIGFKNGRIEEYSINKSQRSIFNTSSTIRLNIKVLYKQNEP